MSHQNLKVWLEEYAEDSLPPELSQDLGQHLAICQECQEQLKAIRLTRNIIRASALDEAPFPAPGFARSIFGSIEQQKELYFFWNPLRLAALKALPVMAGLALLLGGFAYVEISALNAQQLPEEPLLESSLELSSQQWGREGAVFSDSISQDQEQVVSTLMEGPPNPPNPGKETEK